MDKDKIIALWEQHLGAELFAKASLAHAQYEPLARPTRFELLTPRFVVLVIRPVWVKSDGSAMSALLPLCPRKPTFIGRVGMSQKCQEQTKGRGNSIVRH